MLYSKFALFFLFINILLCYVCHVWGKEEKLRSPHESMSITAELSSGEYLIYQCKDKHFACVDEFGFSTCTNRRSIEIYSKKKPSCVPLRKFSHHLDCVSDLYQIMDRMGQGLELPENYCQSPSH